MFRFRSLMLTAVAAGAMAFGSLGTASSAEAHGFYGRGFGYGYPGYSVGYRRAVSPVYVAPRRGFYSPYRSFYGPRHYYPARRGGVFVSFGF
ncbi:MAG: hypothetical protein AAGJ46_12260 [Planctomycetota bacterium]